MSAKWLPIFLLVLACGKSKGDSGTPGASEEDVPDSAETPMDVAPLADTVETSDDSFVAPACVGAGEVPDFSVPIAFEPRKLNPAKIEKKTDQRPGVDHWVVAPSHKPARNELLVILPGTGGTPSNNEQLLRIGVRAGFRSIGLAYVNELNDDESCGGEADDACLEDVKRAKVYGLPGGSTLEIDWEDSIVGRLTLLLGELHARFPEEGWGAFVEEGSPAWASIILVGFSQGSGMTGYIGREEALARSVFLSSGGDTLLSPEGEPVQASWELQPRQTPASKMYGMLHAEDNWDSKSIHYESYGMTSFGPFSNAGENSPPHACSHILVSTETPRNGADEFHRSLAHDNFMPLDADGIPTLAEDYYWLFGGLD